MNEAVGGLTYDEVLYRPGCDRIAIEMVESYTKSLEYKEGIKKVGPGSIFYYRCIFDPVPSRELKNPEKYGAEDPKDV